MFGLNYYLSVGGWGRYLVFFNANVLEKNSSRRHWFRVKPGHRVGTGIDKLTSRKFVWIRIKVNRADIVWLKEGELKKIRYYKNI